MLLKIMRGWMPPVILLADANNFYASCEAALNPQLAGKPLLVLSNNDGCIVARSAAAKKLGFKMGQPLFQCLDLVKKHEVEVVSSNYPLYADMSARVMQVLARFAPQMEPYSIDEAFLALPGFSPAELDWHSKTLRDTVRRWTGITVSVGLAITKTLAKIANERAKKVPELEGVFDISAYSTEKLDELLANTEVEDVWGIGRQRGRLLRQYGYSTAYDLKYAPDGWLKKNLTITGLRTAWELRGIPCLPLELAPPPKKAIACTRSFGGSVTKLAELREAVATYSSRVAEKLREQGSVAGVIQVFIHTNHFNPREPYYANHYTMRLAQPSSFSPTLVNYAQHALEQIYRPGYRYIKAGVIVTDLSSQSAFQLGLLEGPDPWEVEGEGRLMSAVDTLNQRFGREKVRLASSGLERRWWMKQTRLSPRYTTNWQELPIAFAT